MDLNLGAPFDMISPIVVVEIESRLERVEEVEKRQRRDAHNLFMRVKVAILVAKLIRRGGVRGRVERATQLGDVQI